MISEMLQFDCAMKADWRSSSSSREKGELHSFKVNSGFDESRHSIDWRLVSSLADLKLVKRRPPSDAPLQLALLFASDKSEPTILENC